MNTTTGTGEGNASPVPVCVRTGSLFVIRGNVAGSTRLVFVIRGRLKSIDGLARLALIRPAARPLGANFCVSKHTRSATQINKFILAHIRADKNINKYIYSLLHGGK